jgi:hypothetical protein
MVLLLPVLNTVTSSLFEKKDRDRRVMKKRMERKAYRE